ncbi:hypothetical protein [Paenibacillus sp. SI8]|uniref:hypothetical protein n=1 Tax=unclassified Paenibacillus TaxID=185978 RepID=UPI0034653694
MSYFIGKSKFSLEFERDSGQFDLRGKGHGMPKQHGSLELDVRVLGCHAVSNYTKCKIRNPILKHFV